MRAYYFLDFSRSHLVCPGAIQRYHVAGKEFLKLQTSMPALHRPNVVLRIIQAIVAQIGNRLTHCFIQRAKLGQNDRMLRLHRRQFAQAFMFLHLTMPENALKLENELGHDQKVSVQNPGLRGTLDTGLRGIHLPTALAPGLG